MTKRNTTNRTAKVTAAKLTTAFRKPVVTLDAFDATGQFRILELTRQIKRIAGEYDEAGDKLWRMADEVEQIIEARG